MAPSIEAQVKQKRHQLIADGVNDPFVLLAEVLVRNEELQAQVECLRRIVNQRGAQPRALNLTSCA
jgi:hypothetical protein